MATNNAKRRPGMTAEARENQLISLAVDLAEKQLREGTASAQVISHYIKMGSTKERLEKEILEKQKDLLVAKTEAIQSTKEIEALYANAIEAMKSYGGSLRTEVEEIDDYDEDQYYD